jgi:hypothetical protein
LFFSEYTVSLTPGSVLVYEMAKASRGSATTREGRREYRGLEARARAGANTASVSRLLPGDSLISIRFPSLVMKGKLSNRAVHPARRNAAAASAPHAETFLNRSPGW